MELSAEHFPILSIQEFRENESSGQDLLYNEIRGKRIIDAPHKHDFFIIMLFENGGGTHTIDFTAYQTEGRQLHLVFPEQVHHWHLLENTVAFQLMISRKWFESLLPSLRFSASYYQDNPVFTVQEDAYDSLVYEFESIRKELKEENISWELVQMRARVIGLLVSKSVENAGKGFDAYRSNPTISSFLASIDQHFKQEKSVSFYAEKLNISANYLNMICRKNLNAPASSFIQNRLLLEAKRLLKVSEMSVKDIVYDLGFYDHANFSKFFKTQTGMTPSQFREQ